MLDRPDTPKEGGSGERGFVSMPALDLYAGSYSQGPLQEPGQLTALLVAKTASSIANTCPRAVICQGADRW